MITLGQMIVFIGLIFFINRQQRKKNTLSRLVLIGLITGSLYGLALQLIHADNSLVIKNTLEWVNIVGSGYVGLLND